MKKHVAAFLVLMLSLVCMLCVPAFAADEPDDAIKVTLPTALTVYDNRDGTYDVSAASIINQGRANVVVSDVSASASAGWSLVDWDSTAEYTVTDAKYVSAEFFGAGIDSSGKVSGAPLPAVKAGRAADLEYDFWMSPQADALPAGTQIATTVVTIGLDGNGGLAGITVTTPPDKTEYEPGDDFDPAGMTVEATYFDGSTADVTDEVVIENGTDLTLEQTQVDVTYTEDNHTATAPVAITVKDPAVYAILYEDGELVFQRGNTPEAGRTVVATYSDIETWERTGSVQLGGSPGSSPWQSALYDRSSLIKSVTFNTVVSPIDTSGWFNNCTNLTTINHIERLDTSKVTDMRGMFYDCSRLTGLDCSGFDTSLVTDMSEMFYRCSSLSSLDVSGFDTSLVTDMNNMFNNCTSLTSLDVTSFDVNNVTDISRMFSRCDGLTELDLSTWEVDASAYSSYTFAYNPNLQTIYATDDFKAQRFDTIYDCPNLVGGCGTAYADYGSKMEYVRVDRPGQPGYFTEKGADYSVCAILYSDGELVFQRGTTPEDGRTVVATYSDVETTYPRQWGAHADDILIVTFDTEVAPDDTAQWFNNCTNLTTINHIERLDTSNVRSMNAMFYRCSSLTELDCSSFDMSNVVDIGAMFTGCKNLVSLDVSNWTTDSVQNMNAVFSNCNNLTSVDPSGWTTDNVLDMSGMFSWCYEITELDLSGWNTSLVTKMNNMFSACTALSTLDVSAFDTANVRYMDSMFHSCSSLTELDLSGWDTSSVIQMSNMFRFCSNLTTIYATDSFSTESVTDGGVQMFGSCTSLVGGNGTQAKYLANPSFSYARIDRSGQPGLFTEKNAATFAVTVSNLTNGAASYAAPAAGWSTEEASVPAIQTMSLMAAEPVQRSLFTIACDQPCALGVIRDGQLVGEVIAVSADGSTYGYDPDVKNGDELAIVLVGDANCDGLVDVSDSALIEQYVTGEAELTVYGELAADIDHDGDIDADDALCIAYLGNGYELTWNTGSVNPVQPVETVENIDVTVIDETDGVATVASPENGWVAGENSFTVSSTAPVSVYHIRPDAEPVELTCETVDDTTALYTADLQDGDSLLIQLAAEQPTEGETEQPEQSEQDTTEQPTEGETEQPEQSEQDTTEQPTEGETEQPEQSEQDTTEQPTEGETEQPEQSEQDTTEQPTEGETEQPEQSEQDTTEPPTEGETEQPEQDTTEQPTEGETEQDAGI